MSSEKKRERGVIFGVTLSASVLSTHRFFLQRRLTS